MLLWKRWQFAPGKLVIVFVGCRFGSIRRAYPFLASFQSSDMLCRRAVLLHPAFSKQHQGKSHGMDTSNPGILLRVVFLKSQNDGLMA